MKEIEVAELVMFLVRERGVASTSPILELDYKTFRRSLTSSRRVVSM